LLIIIFFFCLFFYFQEKAKKVVVVGGGYIGMEIAAAAVAWKLDTTVCVFPTLFLLGNAKSTLSNTL
jgi:pyruvate/2-oxoglutarate dehydrogenase complex dihydrolipoamide dehydrogenase (E3) component